MKTVLSRFPLLGAMLAGLVPAAWAAPKIECDQPRFDFGRQLNTTVVEHVFTLRNAGDEVLVIQSVQPSCGCTLADIGNKNLAPGETTTVKARLDLSNRLGKQDKHISVFSNDPETRTFTLLMSGEAFSAIQLDPGIVSFGTIPQTGTVVRTVFVTCPLGKKFKVLDVVSPQKLFKSKITPVVEGEKYQIDITPVLGEKSGGVLSDTLVVYTDLPEARVLSLAAYGQVPEPITYSPSMITLLTNTGPRPVTRYITLRPGLVSSFKVLKVETPDPAIQASVREQTRYGFQIMLQGLRASQKELMGKDIIVYTDAPGREEIRIPIQLLDSAGKVVPPVPAKDP